jgi:DNA-binding response OmpR family regulator
MTAVASSILVVDDDADQRTLLMTYLASEGYSVIDADSGEQALERIAAAPIALVLLDIMLPGLSGFEVCQHLKRDPKTASIPVLMVTAHGDPLSRARAFDSDADEFIAKPVFRLELLARVRALLRLRRTQVDKDSALQALEQKKQHRLRELLGRYLPPADADRLMQLGAEERDALLQRALRAALAEAPPPAPDR